MKKTRDIVLESLRTNFKAKVRTIELHGRNGYLAVDIVTPLPEVDAFLRDLANNITQVLTLDDDTFHNEEHES